MRKLALVLGLCGAIFLPMSAKAYTWMGNHWKYGNPTNVGVTIGTSIPGNWAYYFGIAMSRWNNAGAKFNFYTEWNGSHKINLKWLADAGALAVTYIHEGYGSKVTSDRDIDFNSRYSWDVNGAAGKYDAWSVVTHELGHWLTLGDLYSSADYWKTMYGYGSAGETYKRTLESDDIAGIRKIYGVK